MRKTITYNCFSFADLEHLEGEEWLPAGRGGKILCICEGDTASNEVFFSRKLQFQVLENIVSRQGSSQLASSPLKVLASWLALTHIVIIVIRQMQCCQWRSVSHLEFFSKNMLCCLNHRLCCYTKGFITFCFTDSLIREPLELSLPSKTLILFEGSVLRCFSDSYVPNFSGHFQPPTHTEHEVILKSLVKLGAFSWSTLLFSPHSKQ